MIYFLFIIGIIVGSFLNVLIYRIPHNEEVVKSRSYCPKCNTQLNWYDLIPVISYIFSKGRCRYCNSKISLQYPLVEILSGLVVVITYLHFPSAVSFKFFLVLLWLFIVIAYIDYQHQIIPNELNMTLISFGFAYSLISEITIKHMFLNALIPFLVIWSIVVISKGGMGMGDAKLSLGIGLFIGYKYTLFALLIACLIASFYGFILIIFTSSNRKTKIPFAPFIIIGSTLMVFYGNIIFNTYWNFIT